MTTETHDGVILVGGPRDGLVLDAVPSTVVELEIDGMIHRYVMTTKQRDDGDRSYQVFNYDGEIDPTGAQPGAEIPDGGHHDPISDV
jgi:hypothetical protein